MKEKNIRRLPYWTRAPGRHYHCKDLIEPHHPAHHLSIFELNYLLAKTKVRDVFPPTRDLLPSDPTTISRPRQINAWNPNKQSGRFWMRAVSYNHEPIFSGPLVDILGVKRPHTRIDTLIPEGPGSLAEITGLMADRGINIINTVVYYDPDIDKYKLILRIEELNYEPV
jgi:acetoin utilization protein AcuB